MFMAPYFFLNRNLCTFQLKLQPFKITTFFTWSKNMIIGQNIVIVNPGMQPNCSCSDQIALMFSSNKKVMIYVWKRFFNVFVNKHGLIFNNLKIN